MDTEKFIGPKRVTALVIEPDTTPSGGVVITVHYEGGSTELMTQKTFDLLATEKATDLTDLQRRKINVVVPSVLEVISDYGLKVEEIDILLRTIGMELDNSFNRATNWLWTKNDGLFIPGVNCIDGRSTLEVQRVLKTITKNEAEDPKTEI